MLFDFFLFFVFLFLFSMFFIVSWYIKQFLGGLHLFWEDFVSFQGEPEAALPHWKATLLNHTSTWVFSCKFAAYFQNIFSEEHIWRASSGEQSAIIEKNQVQVIPFNKKAVMKMSRISNSNFVGSFSRIVCWIFLVFKVN